MPYRNRKLLDLAHRVQECQFQIPGHCEGFSQDGCEPAHSNHSWHGKGMGQKARDYYHVAACASCHRAYDGCGGFGREHRAELFQAGWERTMALYWRNGWIGVTTEGKKR